MMHFDALANADWKGVMDMDPQQEPMEPQAVPEKTWADLAWDARRSISNAERCESVCLKRANLIIARTQLSQALERLR